MGPLHDAPDGRGASHPATRRRSIIVPAVIATLLVAGFLVRAIWLTDSAEAVNPNDAVHRYRAHTSLAEGSVTTSTQPPVAALALPEPGVYRYATTGKEWINAMGGADHNYPAETALTVTPDGCGVSLRWDLLKERHEMWRLCVTADGIELQPTGETYHEFFKTGRVEAVTCDRAVLLVPRDTAPRAAVPQACTLNTRPWAPAWQVIGEDTATAGGTTVPVTHVIMRVTNDSHYDEHTTVEWWLDAHGLPVKMSTTKESLSDSGIVGDVRYHETYRAELQSLTPMR
jgi:hypothetical protein